MVADDVEGMAEGDQARLVCIQKWKRQGADQAREGETLWKKI